MGGSLAILALAAVLVVACDSGPDPEQARAYAAQIDDKVARQCGPGYEAFLRRNPPRGAETTLITAPLKSIEIFPPIFFAIFDEREFESFADGYPDDVRDRLIDLKFEVKLAGAALKLDYAQSNWETYCGRMREISQVLKRLG